MKTPTKTLEKPLHKVWADAVRASGVVCNKPTALFGLAWVERDGKLEDPIAVDSMKGIRALFGSDPYIRSIWVLHQEQPEEPRLYTRYRFRVPAKRYAPDKKPAEVKRDRIVGLPGLSKQDGEAA